MTTKTLSKLKMSHPAIRCGGCSEVVTKSWWLGCSKNWERGLSSIAGKAAQDRCGTGVGQVWDTVSPPVCEDGTGEGRWWTVGIIVWVGTTLWRFWGASELHSLGSDLYYQLAR